MSRSFVSLVLLCCFLHGLVVFTYNITTPNVSLVEDIDGMDLYSPFLQLRASLPSYSQPIRPYSLVTNREDYHNMPNPKHRRPTRLLRLLGTHFDPFWMSVDHPSEATGVWISGREQGAVVHGDAFKLVKNKFNLGASPQLRLAAENHRLKLSAEAAGLDLSYFPSDVAKTVQDWLVNSATCGLRYEWVDLGLAFWPRWLRHTDCERTDVTRKCSFPSGMVCKRAQTAHIKILAWHCQETEEPFTPRSIKDDGFESSSINDTVKNIKCVWKQVPYPVVTACECSCK